MRTPEIDRPNGDADDGMGINKWLWQPRKGGQIYLRFRYCDLDGKYNGLRRSQGQLIRRITVPPPLQFQAVKNPAGIDA